MMANFKRLGLLAGLLLLVSCGKPDVYDVEGKGLRLAELHDKVLIVNYWATWCAPCIKEIPELNELAQAHAETITLVGVNYDQPEGQEAIKQTERMKIEFPVLAGNPAAILGVETPTVLPTTYIFARGGELHATLVGPQTEATILAALPGQ
ncbi:MAG: TlpA family protein disulfide reductase [Pseudomonadales bacterium]|jgi:thiol-disulfide isomerase/thioredoxin